MELHELEVGDARAGRPGHRDPVAGRHLGVGRLAEHLAGAAGREQRRAGPGGPSRAVRIQVLDADGAAVLDQDRGGARVLDGVDAPVRRGAGPQGPADRPAGGVARVQHAADAVRRLAGQRDLAVRLAIEGRPPVHQLVDVGRTLGHENAHRVDVAEPVAGGQRVLLVEPRIVVVAHRGGDAALGVAGVALGRGRLGQEEDLPGLRERQRGPERGDPAADDEVVRGRGQGSRHPLRAKAVARLRRGYGARATAATVS